MLLFVSPSGHAAMDGLDNSFGSILIVILIGAVLFAPVLLLWLLNDWIADKINPRKNPWIIHTKEKPRVHTRQVADKSPSKAESDLQIDVSRADRPGLVQFAGQRGVKLRMQIATCLVPSIRTGGLNGFIAYFGC